LKKLLVLVVTLAGAASAYRRLQADRAEADLWAEATAQPDLR
jgi:hypothetical protein